MTSVFRIRRDLLEQIRADLRRRHPFAHERVGFILARAGIVAPTGIAILAYDYHMVADEDYLPDRRVGAMMGSAAIRKALQTAYHAECSMFHVHSHGGRGTPWFSGIDLRESAKFVPDLFNVAPRVPHGTLVLSETAAAGLCWLTAHERPVPIDEIIEVGAPLHIHRSPA